jgi:hypothetical protein
MITAKNANCGWEGGRQMYISISIFILIEIALSYSTHSICKISYSSSFLLLLLKTHGTMSDEF